MRKCVLTMLVLSAVPAAACGPSHGLRVEPGVTQPAPDRAGTTADIHVVSGTTVAGLPVALASNGRTIFATVIGLAGLGVQAIDPRTSQARGVVLTGYLSNVPASITTTPETLWVLAPLQDRSELIHIDTRKPRIMQTVQTAGARLGIYSFDRRPLVLPRDTWLVGTTPFAVWLVSHTTTGYTRWRRDVQTWEHSHFALSTDDVPGVVITARHVFVFLRSGHEGTVRIQTRDTGGAIVATSPPLRIQGFQPKPLRGCGNQIFGWTRGPRGVGIFGIEPTGGRLRYSKLLPPSAFYPSGVSKTGVNGIVLSEHCRTVWAATSSDDIGVVSRLRASSLTLTGQVDTSPIRALLWSDGSLWGTSVDHAAIMRIR
ncbi:MAG: hypothetical protein QOD65_3775 [Gaiellales bacterium]|nr:hypothetical protein [Gaiellales bacterium]